MFGLNDLYGLREQQRQNGTLILAVGRRNVKPGQSTGFNTPISPVDAVHIEQERGHRVNVTLQLLKLGRGPFVRFRPNEIPQSF